jgi:hypothetical protein
MKNLTDYKTDKVKLELEKGQKLIVTHKGSAWIFLIEVDNYDDLNIKKISNYRTPTHLKELKTQDTLDNLA